MLYKIIRKGIKAHVYNQKMRKSLIPPTPVTQKKPNESQALRSASGKKSQSQSPIRKKKIAKIDLKLDYMQNQIHQINNFKGFLENINFSTKELISISQSKTQIANEHSQKRRNSFSLNNQMFRNHLSQKDHSNSQSSETKDITIIQPKQSQKSISSYSINQSKAQHKPIDLNRLCRISKLIAEKKADVNKQIQRLNQKIVHSSMWQDKQFYDFTELHYETNMAQIQQRLKNSEIKLQQRQNQKKADPQKVYKVYKNTSIIRYGLYQSDSKQGNSLTQYFNVKNKIMAELKHINCIYARFQQLKTNSSFNASHDKTQMSRHSENTPDLLQDLKTHPLIQSVNLLKSQFQKFAELIKAYRVYTKKKKQNDQSQTDNIKTLLYHKVHILNKQILQKDLIQTKKKITKLKYETQTIEKGIKQLQAFKALTILRNKQIQHKQNPSKKGNSLKQGHKNAYDDEILRIILEHQFFQKSRALRIQTKFNGLQKRNVRSTTESFTGRQVNYLRNAKFLKKCQSAKQMDFQLKQTQNGKQMIKQRATKALKRSGLQIVSLSSPNKQPESSTQTNP